LHAILPSRENVIAADVLQPESLRLPAALATVTMTTIIAETQ
jgi:hypothetical protein